MKKPAKFFTVIFTLLTGLILTIEVIIKTVEGIQPHHMVLPLWSILLVIFVIAIILFLVMFFKRPASTVAIIVVAMIAPSLFMVTSCTRSCTRFGINLVNGVRAKDAANAREFAEYPRHGQGYADKNKPLKVWLVPGITVIDKHKTDDVRLVYVVNNKPSGIFFIDRRGQNINRKQYLKLPAGKYFVYPCNKDKIFFSWHQ